MKALQDIELCCALSDPSDPFCGLRDDLSQSINYTLTIILISPGGVSRLNCSASRIRKAPGSRATGQEMVLLWEIVKCILPRDSGERVRLLSWQGYSRERGRSLVAAQIQVSLPSLPPVYAVEELCSCTGHPLSSPVSTSASRRHVRTRSWPHPQPQQQHLQPATSSV